MSLSKTTYRIVFFASFIWCLSIIAPPIAVHFGAVRLADFIYGFFSRICHQLDSHSLHVFDAKLAVCARCTAIYYGFFVSVVLYPLFLRKKLPATVAKTILNSPWTLFLSVLPILLDLGLSEIGVHESTLITRVVTGVIFGIALPFILIPPAEEALEELRLKLSLSFLGKIRHAD
jgi:uncharacterized membrane protein